MFDKSLSVVLPAYNEEGNIMKVAKDCLNFLKNNFKDYELIIVDDGSTDITGLLSDELARGEEGIVRVFHHSPNKGYGAALNTGLFNARCDLVFYTDADNQFDIAELKNFVPLMEKYDIAVGYRDKRKDAWYRLSVSYCYNRLVSLVFGIRVRDVNCSFKLFRNSALKKLSIETAKFFVDAELIAKAYKQNLIIVEKPVGHFYRERGSTKVNIGYVFTTLREIFYIWNKLRFTK